MRQFIGCSARPSSVLRRRPTDRRSVCVLRTARTIRLTWCTPAPLLQVYEYQEHLLQVPPSPLSGGQNVLNGHGIARDATGNLFYTFQPAQVVSCTRYYAKV